ncbi:MAG: hypothetical protein JWM99_5005 [Verrucomicrobiales bacterium]|nr:hypothetical protein [Verrucomicrobiales bacterium]
MITRSKVSWIVALAAVIAVVGIVASKIGKRPPLKPVSQAAAQSSDFFEEKIRPILSDNCYKCHSATSEKLKGGLLLDTREGLLKGGDTGPAIVAGNPEQSLLIRAVRYTDKDLQMPPGDKPLATDQIKDLETWVKMGAPDPRVGALAHTYKVDFNQARKHWAFQPIKAPAIPRLKDPDNWARSPVDQFILEKLAGKKMKPSPEADKVTLLRRASFDLTGLPPTPQELVDFLGDSSTNAFSTVVDRLLNSPRYGERWGRYWLDLAHYSDTRGTSDGNRNNRYNFAYTYRDYVIKAFNDDLPYDQFLIQQIAGDRLPDLETNKLAALGFLTLGNRFGNQINDIIDDRIDIIGKGTMALTLTCARCHDHKFDPIPTEDYYSLHGIFASSIEPKEGPIVSIPTNAAMYADFERQLGVKQKALDDYRASLALKLKEELFGKAGDYMLAIHEYKHGPADKPLGPFLQKKGLSPPAGVPWERTLKVAERKHDPIFVPWFEFASVDGPDFATKAREISERYKAAPPSSDKCNPEVAKFFVIPPASMAQVASRYSTLFSNIEKRWDTTLATAQALKKEEPDGFAEPANEEIRQFLFAKGSPTSLDEARINNLIRRDNKARNNLGTLEKAFDDLKQEHPGSPAHAHFLTDSPKPKDSYVFIKGNPGSKGPVAPRRFLKVLSGENRQVFNEGSGRLQLARAIASPDNPLTPRVLVNRIWLHHFGEGLVRNPDDFGTRSDPPTHPELLDYLASQFVNNGWSIKKLHREIMLSSVYQQSSDGTQYAQADPENRWLWRMNRRRLDFESMRDTILTIGGKLDTVMGGPPVRLDAEPYPVRRSVYGYIDRSNLPGMFIAFDFASPDLTTGHRETTTLPQQALFMMNSPLVVEQARDLVKRPDFRSATGLQQKIALLYYIIYQRAPKPVEVELASKFLESQSENLRSSSTVSAWRYGYGEFDPFTKKVKRFIPMAVFTGKIWFPDPKPGDNKLPGAALTADGGHAANQYAVIRRWTAPRGGFISIKGVVAHPSNVGDGIQARIVSNRFGQVASWVVFKNKVETALPRLAVQQDDTIDFIVEPRSNPQGDSFAWAPTIQMHPATADQPAEWSALHDFAGEIIGRSMDPWEKFAQVLLETNELAFIN